MVVRVKLAGSGVKGDAYRAPLPTYNEILTLIDQGIVYVTIDDPEHPELFNHPSAKFERTGAGDALIALDDAGHQDWYEHLDRRYQEHKGKFRPEVA